MKVLSVKQPWGSMLVQGWKSHENRTWPKTEKSQARVLGKWVLIHASKTEDREAGGLLVLADTTVIGEAGPPYVASLPYLQICWSMLHPFNASSCLSAIIGAIRIGGFVTESESQWFCGPVGWVASDAICFREPFRCDGMLGLWNAPERLDRELPRLLDSAIFARHNGAMIAPRDVEPGEVRLEDFAGGPGDSIRTR